MSLRRFFMNKLNYYTSDCDNSNNLDRNACSYGLNSTCELMGTQAVKRAYYKDDETCYMSEMLQSMEGYQTGAFFQYYSCATDICNLTVPDGFENSSCIAVDSVERYYYYANDGQAYMIEVTTEIDEVSYYRLYKQLQLSEVPTPLKAFNDVLVGEVTVLPSSVPSQSDVIEARRSSCEPKPCLF